MMKWNLPRGLNSLKSKVDKLHIDKLAPFPVDLEKLSNVVDNDVSKKTAYDILVKKTMLSILVDLLVKQVVIQSSKILKVKYLVLLT